MTRREIVKSSAWAGILLTSSIGSLFQDFMGQEGYMRLVREHWIPWVYSVPIALLGVIFAVMVLFMCFKSEMTDTE